MQNTIKVSLNISAEEYLRIYQGSARAIQAMSFDGRRVRFPANILQPFVTHEGISGEFLIICDQDNRFKKIVREQTFSH